MSQVSIHSSRYEHLHEEFDKPYFAQIKEFLLNEKKQGKVIYPAGANIFKALDLTPFNNVKVVILGQDPYHGMGQAMGLSFSVPPTVIKPPSLVNMYKELADEYPGYDVTQSGDLTRWATQGVLLLNAILTVRAGEAASHRQIGWQQFTDTIIRTLSDERSGIVFLLWGAYAQSKVSLIDTTKHHVLTAPHPSPLSAHRGWFGCNHFNKANDYLRERGKKEIVW